MAYAQSSSYTNRSHCVEFLAQQLDVVKHVHAVTDKEQIAFLRQHCFDIVLLCDQLLTRVASDVEPGH